MLRWSYISFWDLGSYVLGFKYRVFVLWIYGIVSGWLDIWVLIFLFGIGGFFRFALFALLSAASCSFYYSVIRVIGMGTCVFFRFTWSRYLVFCRGWLFIYYRLYGRRVFVALFVYKGVWGSRVIVYVFCVYVWFSSKRFVVFLKKSVAVAVFYARWI